MLSVIVLTYNDPRRLRLCLHGLLRQTLSDFELLVVHDGGDPQINLPVYKEIGQHGRHIAELWLGPESSDSHESAARNLGLRHTQGERVLFLDGDCIPAPNVVAEHAAYGGANVLVNGVRKHLPEEIVDRLQPTQFDELEQYVSNLDRRLRWAGPKFRQLRARFWRGERDLPFTDYWQAQSFQLSVPTGLVRAIGGFNETFVGYGGEDTELAGRMERAGTALRVRFDLLSFHLDHAPRGRPRDSARWMKRVNESLLQPDPVRNGGPLPGPDDMASAQNLGPLEPDQPNPVRPLRKAAILHEINQVWSLTGTGHFSLLSLTPAIFYVWYGFRGLEQLLHGLADQSVDLVLMFGWHLDMVMVRSLAAAIGRWHKKYPLVRFHCAANTTAEVDLLRQLTGCQTILCSAAALLDERIWRPDPAAPPPNYDAILDSVLAPYKRLELAVEVSRLAVVSYTNSENYDPDYAQRTSTAFHAAHWFNHPLDSAYRFLAPEEIAATYRQCRVGLILSETEGACYASLQYLLTGLPVVSTPSFGGRDLFYNAQNAIIAEPTPAAVREAVATWLARAPSPESVRAATLPLVYEHRRNLIGLVNQILADRGAKPDFERRWPEVFFNKQWRRVRYQLGVRSVKTGCDLVHPRNQAPGPVSPNA